MAADLVLSLQEDYAELLDGSGGVVWSSDDDDAFEFDADESAEDIIGYLVRAEIVEAEGDVTEIVDERADGDDDKDDGDDDEADADDDDDDD